MTTPPKPDHEKRPFRFKLEGPFLRVSTMLLITPISPNFKGLKCSVFGRFRALQSRKNYGTIELDLSDIQYVKLPGQTEGQRTKLQKNDILISITADIGMVGIVREMEQNAYINQHIALARPTAKDNAEFLAWYLISDVGLQQMRNKQRGATKIGLGLDDIRSLELLIPTREEQDEVVYILDNLLAKEQQAKKAAEGVLEQIDLIKKAILARAFRGELGTNDPSEESAEELLSSRI